MSAVLQLFPELLDVNGDAQNALVLVRRATWAGLDATLAPVALDARPPTAKPAAVVIGSGVDSALEPVRAALAAWERPLRDWADAGIPVLAVGTGFELLGEGIQLTEGGPLLDGLRLLPGRAIPRAERAVDDLVVDAAEGLLIGFENHARGYLLPADAPALGTVRHGTGNDARTEGARAGSVIGTHLHGPVLAKNPALADAILRAAYGERYRADDERIRFVDETARAARDQIATRLGLKSED